jgi:hypothetical protein
MPSPVFSRVQPFRPTGNCEGAGQDGYSTFFEVEYYFASEQIVLKEAYLHFEAFQPAQSAVDDQHPLNVRATLWSRRPPATGRTEISLEHKEPAKITGKKDVLYKIELAGDPHNDPENPCPQLGISDVLALRLEAQCRVNGVIRNLDGVSCSLTLLLEYESVERLNTLYGVELQFS